VKQLVTPVQNRDVYRSTRKQAQLNRASTDQHRIVAGPADKVFRKRGVIGYAPFCPQHLGAQALVVQFPGDSTYTVTRSYTRQGNMLFVVPAPGIEAGPVLIARLTERQLTLQIAQARVPGAPYSDWELHFVR
jgi:hypothetical protein